MRTKAPPVSHIACGQACWGSGARSEAMPGRVDSCDTGDGATGRCIRPTWRIVIKVDIMYVIRHSIYAQTSPSPELSGPPISFLGARCAVQNENAAVYTDGKLVTIRRESEVVEEAREGSVPHGETGVHVPTSQEL